MPNLLAMAVIDPLCNELSFSIRWSITTICILKFLDRSLFLGGAGVPPCQRRRQTPCSAQTGTTNYDLFSSLLLIVTLDETTIKHLMYTWKVPFLYTERACVLFSSFRSHLGKFFMSTKGSYYYWYCWARHNW